ncbi:MAG: hypothetical protein ACRDTE_08545 [Pseudonocardiaceae bacterium]
MENEHNAARVGIDHFLAIDIRVGQVVHVEPFPKARSPAWSYSPVPTGTWLRA